MSPIIAGHFDLEREARRAVEGLKRQGFAEDDVTAFTVEPAARIGHSVRAESTPAIVDSRAFGQPAPTQTEGRAAHERPRAADSRPLRRGGMLVAVRAREYARRLVAVNVLQAYGARDVERSDGTWIAGKWIDFDPFTPPRLVDPPVACDGWITRKA